MIPGQHTHCRLEAYEKGQTHQLQPPGPAKSGSACQLDDTQLIAHERESLTQVTAADAIYLADQGSLT